jgi:hypothetical protein
VKQQENVLLNIYKCESHKQGLVANIFNKYTERMQEKETHYVHVRTINHRRFACTKVRRPLFFRPAYPAFIIFIFMQTAKFGGKSSVPRSEMKNNQCVYSQTAIGAGSLFFTVNSSLLLRWMLEMKLEEKIKMSNSKVPHTLEMEFIVHFLCKTWQRLVIVFCECAYKLMMPHMASEES